MVRALSSKSDLPHNLLGNIQEILRIKERIIV